MLRFKQCADRDRLPSLSALKRPYISSCGIYLVGWWQSLLREIAIELLGD